MNSFLRGEIPLWVPEMNAGQPLFPVTELWQSTEPVIWLVWGMASKLKVDAQLAASWCGFIWMFIFSLGGMVLSRRIWKNESAQLMVFALLFLGPLSLALPMQSQFLIPFRYFPWLLCAFFSLERNPSYKGSILYGILLCFSSLGYQTLYPLFLLVLFAILCFIGRKIQTGEFPKPLIKAFGISLVFLVPFSFPTLATYPHWKSLVAMVDRTTAYRYPPDYFWNGIVDIFHRTENWHGNSYLGVFPLLFIFISAITLFRKNVGFYEKLIWVFTVLLVTISISSSVASVLRKLTFDARNWGFCFGIAYLSLILCAVSGFRSLSEFLKLKENSVFYQIVLLVSLFDIFIFARLTYNHHPYRIPRMEGIPLIGERETRFVPIRGWEFDVKKYYPYHTEGPSFFGIPSATVPAMYEWGKILNPYTHNFELPRYHRLTRSGVSGPVLGSILGVTAPILRMVPQGIFLKDQDTVIHALKQISDPSELEKTVFLEGMNQTKISSDKIKYEIRIRDFKSSELTLEVLTANAGYLVYSDSYTSDWKARVNGENATIFPANGVSKAIALTPGTHLIEFKYRPMLYVIAFWTRVGCIFGFAAFLFCTFINWIRECAYPRSAANPFASV